MQAQVVPQVSPLLTSIVIHGVGQCPFAQGEICQFYPNDIAMQVTRITQVGPDQWQLSAKHYGAKLALN